MGAKERSGMKTAIGEALKSRPATWQEFNEWASDLHEKAREIYDDYQETYDNLEGGLQTSWEDKFGGERDEWSELADNLSEPDLAELSGEDKPELGEEDDKDSFWERVDAWVESGVDEVTSRVEALL